MQAILLTEVDGVVTATLNRPDKKNAIDAVMVGELHELCADLETTPRTLVIQGAQGVFAAGADIAQLRERRRADALQGINSRIFDRIAKLPMPTIAVIEGYALGGGAELAFACDFRLGTTTAKIGNPETGLGILAAAGASWRLKELVGEPLAKEILLAGRILSGTEAAEVRLFNTACETRAELDEALKALLKGISRQAPLALQLTKKAIHAPREAHPMIDEIAQAVLFETDEKYARMTAFLERSSK